MFLICIMYYLWLLGAGAMTEWVLDRCSPPHTPLLSHSPHMYSYEPLQRGLTGIFLTKTTQQPLLSETYTSVFFYAWISFPSRWNKPPGLPHLLRINLLSLLRWVLLAWRFNCCFSFRHTRNLKWLRLFLAGETSQFIGECWVRKSSWSILS